MTLMLNIFNLADNTGKAALQAESTITSFSAKNAGEFKKFREEMLELEFKVKKLEEKANQTKQ